MVKNILSTKGSEISILSSSDSLAIREKNDKMFPFLDLFRIFDPKFDNFKLANFLNDDSGSDCLNFRESEKSFPGRNRIEDFAELGGAKL